MKSQFTKYKTSTGTLASIRKEWESYKKGNIRIQTLNDLEKILGLSKGMMTQYLNGHKQLNIEMIFKLASLFGCTPYDLDKEFPTWIEGTYLL